MLFEKIKGHGEVLHRFEKSVLSKEFEGIYLFTGPASVGKLMIARQLAKYLLCTGLVDDTCRCESCRLFPHVPDYYEVAKGDESINISEVDGFIDFVSLVPYRSRLRVAIIDNAHNLNHTAASSLLKTLEDLKSNCAVIFVTSQPEQLFPTIVSRCYPVEFGPLQTEHIVEILKSKGHATDKLEDMRKMIPYMTNNVLVNFAKYAAYCKSTPQFLKDVLTMKEDELLSYIKDIEEQHELPFFLETLIIGVNDILKLRYDSPDVVLNLKHLDFLEELTVSWKEEICILVLEKLRSVQNQMNHNINLKLEQFVRPVFCWLYYFLQKEKLSSEPK
jgi:DNA polymerase-3 subunit delta'